MASLRAAEVTKISVKSGPPKVTEGAGMGILCFFTLRVTPDNAAAEPLSGPKKPLGVHSESVRNTFLIRAKNISNPGIKANRRPHNGKPANVRRFEHGDAIGPEFKFIVVQAGANVFSEQPS